MKPITTLAAAAVVGVLGTLPASAATVTFWSEGQDATSNSDGVRFSITCMDSGGVVQANCSGALIDVGSNLFDANALNGLNGDMTDRSTLNTDGNSGVSEAEEFAFINNYVGAGGSLTGVKSGDIGEETYSFTTAAQYILFTVGNDPRHGLLRNDSGAALRVTFQQLGNGTGLSHYTTAGQVGTIPLPAAGVLLLAGLGGLGGIAMRRKSRR